jgi:hypothetical protein
MWRSVIDELENEQAVGDAFPVVCHQHPEAIEYVSKPGVLPRIAPDGESCSYIGITLVDTVLKGVA